MQRSGPRDHQRYKSTGLDKMAGRSSVNDMSRNIFSPSNVGDKSPSSNSKSGMFVYAQPLGGMHLMPAQKHSVSQSFKIDTGM